MSSLSRNFSKLDAAVSSRAASASALDVANWTGTRAGKLDGIIQNTAIVSVQTGYAVLSGAGSGEDGKYVDVAITAVAAINKCLVLIVGGYPNDYTFTFGVTARLTAAGNLRVSGSANAYAARWILVEFK